MKTKFKYIEIRDQLLEEAVKKQIHRLPSEREICRRFRVSRNTARKSLKSLQEQELVTRDIGRGTFLISSSIRRKVQIFTHLKNPDITKFLNEELLHFSQLFPDCEFELVQDTQSGLMKRIYRDTPSIKLLFSSHFGYLSEMRQLFPLNEIPGFKDAVSEIAPDFLEWHDFFGGSRQCYSVPLYIDVCALGYNYDYALKLGLNAEKGPEDWNDLIAWNREAKKAGMCGIHIPRSVSSINRLPPISFYTALANGRRMLTVDKDHNVSFDFSFGADWINYFKELVSAGLECRPSESHPLFDGDTLFDINVGCWGLSPNNKANSIYFKPLPAPSPLQGGRMYPRISCFSMALIDDGLLDCSSREIAMQLMGLLCSKPTQVRVRDNLFRMSVNTAVLEEQKRSNAWSPFIKSLETGLFRNDHPLQHGVTRTLQKYFFPAIYGVCSVETAVEKIQDICNILAELENDRLAF